MLANIAFNYEIECDGLHETSGEPRGETKDFVEDFPSGLLPFRFLNTIFSDYDD